MWLIMLLLVHKMCDWRVDSLIAQSDMRRNKICHDGVISTGWGGVSSTGVNITQLHVEFIPLYLFHKRG